MSGFSHFPLQKAIYELLTGETALMSLVTGVFDKVPENTSFPYIMLGDITSSDWSSKTTLGMECVALLTIFSRKGGRQQATEIMECIQTLLHDADIVVNDHELVMMRFISSNILLEADGETYRGSMRYKALLQAV